MWLYCGTRVVASLVTPFSDFVMQLASGRWYEGLGSTARRSGSLIAPLIALFLDFVSQLGGGGDLSWYRMQSSVGLEDKTKQPLTACAKIISYE